MIRIVTFPPVALTIPIRNSSINHRTGRCTDAQTLTAFTILAGLLAASPALAAPKLGSFGAADTNHDGHVTLQEFENYETPRLMQGTGMVAAHFQKMSPAQQQEALQARFTKLDQGGKGYLDQNDWNSH